MELVLPTMPHLLAKVREETAHWPVQPRIVVEPNEKWAAFRKARAALAASGTVTLELALAGVPTVAAYQVPLIEEIVVRAMLMPETFHDRAGQSGHRRKHHSGVSAARLYAGEARRRSHPAHFRHCRKAAPDRGFSSPRYDYGDRHADTKHAGRRHRRRCCPARPPRSGGRQGGVTALNNVCRRGVIRAISASTSADSRAAANPYRAGADGRVSGADPRSFPSTARSSRRCARARTAP